MKKLLIIIFTKLLKCNLLYLNELLMNDLFYFTKKTYSISCISCMVMFLLG